MEERKEARGTWSLALGAHSLSMARGPEAEQLMKKTEMKDGLRETQVTGLPDQMDVGGGGELVMVLEGSNLRSRKADWG